VISIKNLSAIIKEKEKQVKPEEINFGYCIPDCGSCCPKSNWMSWIIASGIGNKIGVDEDSICSEFSSEPFEDQPCPFIYGYSQCLIYYLDEKHPGCSIFECPKYTAIKEVNETGYNLSGKLKDVWLNQLKGDYNQENWLMLAIYSIQQAHKLVFDKKIPVRLVEPILDRAITLMDEVIKKENK
jgi:hypothetical protein